MATNNYIAAVEIGSSNISGAIAIQTYAGIKILAYASEPVNGFITKGVVRNVDETGNALTSLVNRLETQLENVCVERAYVAFGGLSMQSVKSTVAREFDEYTKITQNIMDEMALENDAVFEVPAGYQKVQVVPLECRLNGDNNPSPIGIPTRRIESNYLNIIIKEQYMRQLEESFELSKLKIMDSFNAARVDAEILLTEEDMICGTAFVNIGAETTTVAVYSGRMLRKLVVIPLGSVNITKDLCAEQIPYNEADQMKIFKGYHSSGDDNSAIPTEIVDKIISARMSEILLNVKHQIETSDEHVARIVFAGGGSRLKNISLLFEECLPNFRIRLAVEPVAGFSVDERLGLAPDAITPTLFGLLSKGKENCCEEIVKETPATAPATDLFGNPIEEQKPEQPDNGHNVNSHPENSGKQSADEKVKDKKPKQRGKGWLGNFFDKTKKFGTDIVESVTEEDNELDYRE